MTRSQETLNVEFVNKRSRQEQRMHHETASAIKHKHEPAIRAMEKRLRRNTDGTITLDAKDAAELAVDPGAFANLQLSLEETNRKIKAGELQPDQVTLTSGI
jgi:hypothetical protein